MRIKLSTVVFFVSIAIGSMCPGQERDYPIRPVPAREVRLSDAFWQPRLEVNRTTTIPLSFQMCEETGRVENFRVAGGLSDANWVGHFGFDDTDVYKVMEGASYSLMTRPDDKLAAYLKELIELIAAAQEDDGYLFTAYTARDRIADPKKIYCCYPRDEKWLSLRDSHELYNLGHMFEAAVAHWEATGDEAFLNVARKSADLLVDTFAPGKMEIPAGHAEVEMALVKLYRATGDARYLDLAKFFLDIRGKPSDERPELWGEYNQDHKPLVEQEEAVGHAVRAMYLYAAATDVAALTGDRQLAAVVDRLWESVFARKAYITGGVGATSEGEAFGKDYELPNDSAYSETCANLATCFWNHRMFLLHGDGKYIDMLERALYNGVIAGVALDGKTFFYPNPLASDGDYARSKWFDCACCPSNICRFIPSVPGYVYAARGDTLYVNLFAAGSADVKLAGGVVHVEQDTAYPWDGRVTIKMDPQTAGHKFAVRVRVPGWASDQAFPLAGNALADEPLYSFSDEPPQEQPRLLLNGEESDGLHREAYYFVAHERQWQPGDTLTLELPMPVRRVVANEKVEADRGRVALMRGPIVYCIEWPDVHGGQVRNLVLPDDKPLASEFRKDLLGGVQVITGSVYHLREVAEAQRDGGSKRIPVMEELTFTAIPYYAWAHRGPGEMAVWLPRTADALERP